MTQLSPSSFGEFSSCQRKYFYRKVMKYANDPDCPEDNEPFQVGKAFHQVLENRKHDLNGLTLKEVALVAAAEGIQDEEVWAMIYAMLGAYKKVFDKQGLKVAGCEIQISSDNFMGFVDVILHDDSGNWWIGDMKTVGTWSDSTIQTLPSHPQLNLYAKHRELIAYATNLDPKKMLGVAYLATTKSRLKKKAKESLEEYVGRLSESVKSIWVFIPNSVLLIKEVSEAHAAAAGFISKVGSAEHESLFDRNYGNCMSYFKPCQFYSRCHTRLFTEDVGVRVESSGN